MSNICTAEILNKALSPATIESSWQTQDLAWQIVGRKCTSAEVIEGLKLARDTIAGIAVAVGYTASDEVSTRRLQVSLDNNLGSTELRILPKDLPELQIA